MANCARRKFYAGFGWIPKLKHCDGYYNEGWVYSCSSSSKGGRLSREVRYQTWCNFEWVFSMKLYYLIIEASWFKPRIKVPPEDQTYTKPIWLKNEWCVETQRYANTHTDLNVSVSWGSLFHMRSMKDTGKP